MDSCWKNVCTCIQRYTYRHTQPFNGPSSTDYLTGLVPEETFTHSHPFGSSDIPYQRLDLVRSVARLRHVHVHMYMRSRVGMPMVSTAQLQTQTMRCRGAMLISISLVLSRRWACTARRYGRQTTFNAANCRLMPATFHTTKHVVCSN